MSKRTVQHFIDAITAHDVKQITALMTDDHLYVDVTGKELHGKEQVTARWEGYLRSFPDHKIEVSHMVADGDTVAAFGFAEGSYMGNKEGHWRLPASWRAIVHNGKISFWQVYGDAQMPFDTMTKADAMAGKSPADMPRVTGVGGLFFKCKDPDAVKKWYGEHLHLKTDKYGANFEWRQGGDPSKYGFTQWSPFSEKTKYFAPSTKDFMINYRVAHLDALIEQLTKDGVTICDTIQRVEYGNFVHILDCEGNKIELWEPVDEEYDKIVGDRTK